jgi:hypothetical protein
MLNSNDMMGMPKRENIYLDKLVFEQEVEIKNYFFFEISYLKKN